MGDKISRKEFLTKVKKIGFYGSGIATGVWSINTIYNNRIDRHKEAEYATEMSKFLPLDTEKIFDNFRDSWTPVLMSRYVKGYPELLNPIVETQLNGSNDQVVSLFESLNSDALKKIESEKKNPHRIIALPIVLSVQSLSILENDSHRIACDIIAKGYGNEHQEVLQIISQVLTSTLSSNSLAWNNLWLTNEILDAIFALLPRYAANPLKNSTSFCLSIHALFYYYVSLDSKYFNPSKEINPIKQKERIHDFFLKIKSSDPVKFSLPNRWINSLESIYKNQREKHQFADFYFPLPPQSSEIVMARFDPSMREIFNYKSDFESLCLINNILAFASSNVSSHDEYSSVNVTSEKILDFLQGCGIRRGLVTQIADEHLKCYPDVKENLLEISNNLNEKDIPAPDDNPYSKAPFKEMSLDGIYRGYFQRKDKYENYDVLGYILSGVTGVFLGKLIDLLDLDRIAGMIENKLKSRDGIKAQEIMNREEIKENLLETFESYDENQPLDQGLNEMSKRNEQDKKLPNKH